LREALPDGPPYRFRIHDRDRICSKELDPALADLGVQVLRRPVRAPQANSLGERLGGSLRRACLDWFIPLNERRLSTIGKFWTQPYHRGRPPCCLSPGLPEPRQESVPAGGHRHQLPAGFRVVKTFVLGGLHHEYLLVKEAA
jgi:hypothetical protein